MRAEVFNRSEPAAEGRSQMSDLAHCAPRGGTPVCEGLGQCRRRAKPEECAALAPSPWVVVLRATSALSCLETRDKACHWVAYEDHGTVPVGDISQAREVIADHHLAMRRTPCLGTGDRPSDGVPARFADMENVNLHATRVLSEKAQRASGRRVIALGYGLNAKGG